MQITHLRGFKPQYLIWMVLHTTSWTNPLVDALLMIVSNLKWCTWCCCLPNNSLQARDYPHHFPQNPGHCGYTHFHSHSPCWFLFLRVKHEYHKFLHQHPHPQFYHWNLHCIKVVHNAEIQCIGCLPAMDYIQLPPTIITPHQSKDNNSYLSQANKDDSTSRLK